MKKPKNLAAAVKLAVLLSAALCAACGAIKNPLRSYSPRPFDAKEWRAGDAIERGRMMHSMYDDRAIDGKSPQELRELLGEPDKKKNVEGDEVWLYRVDLGHNQEIPYLPVTLDAPRGARIGMNNGGKYSLLVAG